MKIIEKDLNNIFMSQVKEKYRVILNKDGSVRSIIEPSESSKTYSQYTIVEIDESEVTKESEGYVVKAKTITSIKQLSLVAAKETEKVK